tara:strand:- start:1196 stop:1648 length:453 start_codon:yes stop_codon:yes gene_type:complete
MSIFSKIGRSIKDFARSDLGKAALVVGGSFLVPGFGAAGATTSLGAQAFTAGKNLYAAGKALIPEKGLLGLKGKIGDTAMSSLMGGGSGGSSSYGRGSTAYSSLASEGLTTYSPEGSQTVSAPAAADYSAFLDESLQLYAYAESQGRKVT